MNQYFSRCFWPMVILGLLFGGTKTLAGENTAAGSLSDEVLLKDGSSFRGTIAESVPGEYLVLVTLTGKTLRFPADQVEYFGPLGKRPVVELKSPGQEGLAARVEVSGKLVPLRFESPQTDVTLFVHSHTAQGEAWLPLGGSIHASVDGYARVCTAPCEARITEGTYRMGLSRGGGVLETGFLDVREPLALEGKIEDRRPLRTMGWVLFAISLVGGSTMMAFSFDENSLEINDGLLVGGSLLMGAGALLSYFLVTAPDRAELTPKPAGL